MAPHKEYSGDFLTLGEIKSLSDTTPHPCEKSYRLISFNGIKGDTVNTLSPSDAGRGRTGTTTTLIMKQASIY